MVSVCMATKNGERYLREQIDSILIQLRSCDELIISDDHSTDRTIEILESYNDSRIKIIKQSASIGIAKNFEASLRSSQGDFIFLADQDDVWHPDKIRIMHHELESCDLVICDCLLADHSLLFKTGSFFSANRSGKGLLKNLIRNSYMGCCMAFNRKVMLRSIPFPKDIPIHDFWIGLIAELYFKVKFIPAVLVQHRRHSSNASSTGSTSKLSFFQRVGYRYRIVKGLLLHQINGE